MNSLDPFIISARIFRVTNASNAAYFICSNVRGRHCQSDICWILFKGFPKKWWQAADKLFPVATSYDLCEYTNSWSGKTPCMFAKAGEKNPSRQDMNIITMSRLVVFNWYEHNMFTESLSIGKTHRQRFVGPCEYQRTRTAKLPWWYPVGKI